MIKIFKKPKVTVEQIHEEFRSAEKRILKECDSILKSLQIPTENAIERKADKLVKLGFVNSETVKQAKIFKERQKLVEEKIKITSKQANYIRDLKIRYPNEKFITVNELEKICNKYNLIHAPAANYIKDIPEKNVIEMANCKKLEQKDKCEEFSILYVDKFLKSTPNELENIFKDGLKVPGIVRGYNYEFFNAAVTYGNYTGERNLHVFENTRIKIPNTSGFFIAAPKSHFNLKDLNKTSKYGFFNVTVTEVKDPVVFEYCKNDICRINTMWGTEDDKSYLDPILFNEKMN